MKSGAGDDPFAEEQDTTTEDPTGRTEHQDSKAETGSSSETDHDDRAVASPESMVKSVDETTNEREELPYIYSRYGVKDDRRMIQYFLREETEVLERDAKQAIESELGTDVYLTDIREALVRIGANHLDEVAAELRDWGYRYEE